MPLDPSIKTLLDGVAGAAQPPLAELSVEQAREQLVFLIALEGEAEAVADVSDRTIPGPAGDIPVRIYRPDDASLGEPRPIIIWYHGGGWVLGNLATADGTCRKLANRTGALVVSVDYRLAPEHPFPAGLDDCTAALRWIFDHGAELGGDPSRIAVGGDSAGANLAAVLALAVRHDGPALRHQLLVYPVTDASLASSSMEANADGYLLTRDSMRWFIDSYLGTDGDRKDPRVAPLLADDVSGVAPATVITAEFDPLCDEGEAYADRLEAAGIAVTRQRYDGMIHGFFGMSLITPVADQAMTLAVDQLRRALA